ncbi:MAG: DUF1987 domain-containing protein [Bacteroidetes bacterium]|nr:DUF1987 domain-containing protein [Bacteroidota bacterium]
MDNLHITPTIKTPAISFNAAGTFSLSGKSIPENSIEFYKSVYEWLDQYAQMPAAETIITIQLEYFNTSSSKCLLDIFRKLEAIYNSGKSKVQIKWMYEEEDEDMMEAGDDYRTLIKLPFDIQKI